MTHGAHGHLKWLSRQVQADTCEDEFLVRLADVYGLERNAAQASTGEVTITGVDTTVCPDETVWVSGDGIRYVQDGAATIVSGQAVITVVAEEGGADGDQVSGVKLTIGSPVAGITATATVSGDGIIDGADIEEIEALRARLLLRLRTPPSGGGPGDYEAWALEVDGVTRAWEYPRLLGPGTVVVYFVRDNDVSIIPSTSEVATVQAYLETKAPVTAEVTAIAPTDVPVDFTFTSLTPDTAAVRAAIEAELEGIFAEAEPGEPTLLSRLNEAISIATGETDHTLSVPAADIEPAAGELSSLGTITWPA